MDIRVGAFRGLLTSTGRLRLQMRTEQGSMFGIHVSYRGDYELPGGRVGPVNLQEALTLPFLLDESAREIKEELGIEVRNPSNPMLYRTVFIAPDGLEDWAFVIPTPPECWDEKAPMTRKTVDVNPDQLRVLGELNLIVSGIGKRMWRMGQASLSFSSKPGFRLDAQRQLSRYKPDWLETEFFQEPDEALARFRQELGL